MLVFLNQVSEVLNVNDSHVSLLSDKTVILRMKLFLKVYEVVKKANKILSRKNDRQNRYDNLTPILYLKIDVYELMSFSTKPSISAFAIGTFS